MIMAKDAKTDKLTAFFRSFAEADEALNFRMACETVGEKTDVISTGTPSLDDALACGGLPCGRLIQYYGAAASGKTLMSLLAIKEAQKKDPTARQLFIDAEQTFSSTWADTLGVDTSRVILIEGDLSSNGRRLFEMLLGVPKENAKHILSGKSREGLLDKIMNKEKEYNINIIVLDSLGAIVPPQEDTAAIGKQNMALLSRFLTTTFRKLSLEVKKANIPFVIINHQKASFDLYGGSHSYSGGNSYTHFLSVNIYFEAVNRADAKILDENENRIGSTIRACVEKNKMGVHPRRCEFKVNFSSGIIDRHEEIGKLATDYDIVLRPNNVMYQYGDVKWRGEGAFLDAIKSSPSLALELEQKIEQARDTKWERKRAEQEAIKAGEIPAVSKKPSALDFINSSKDEEENDLSEVEGE
jgi:recombination protein RecA